MTHEEKERRRNQVMSLWLQGLAQHDIAERLELSVDTVQRDLKARKPAIQAELQRQTTYLVREAARQLRGETPASNLPDLVKLPPRRRREAVSLDYDYAYHDGAGRVTTGHQTLSLRES